MREREKKRKSEREREFAFQLPVYRTWLSQEAKKG